LRGCRRKIRFSASWNKTRPDLLSALIDFERYLYLWAGVFGAHLVRLAGALFGIDPDIVKYLALMEKWAWISTFACFFVRALLKAARGLKRDYTDEK
jgi:hypothetical protein